MSTIQIRPIDGPTKVPPPPTEPDLEDLSKALG